MTRLLNFCLLALAALVATSCSSENYIRSRVVQLWGNAHACTGEQVHAPSGVDYILTAGHCKVLQDARGSITVIDADGNVLQRQVIAEDPQSDLLLIQGLPGMRGLDIASKDYPTEHVRTFTHGAVKPTYKTEGELIAYEELQAPISVIENPQQEAECLSVPKNKVMDIPILFWSVHACVMDVMDVMEVSSTAKIVHGSSGGPVVDDAGDLVGVASAGGEDFYFFVTLKDIKHFLSGY